MNDSMLELSQLENQLMQLYKRYGPIGLISLATLFSVFSTVVLVFLITFVTHGNLQFNFLAEYVYYVVLIPALIAPLVTFFLTRLLAQLDIAFEVVTRLSTTDPLTGSSNRRGFYSAAAKAMHELDNSTVCMVGMIDLDDFKNINDTYGHRIGDNALTAIASQLETTVGEYGVVGRLGGDEFTFFAVGLPENIDALRAAINNQCSQIRVNSEVELSSSIGIALLRKNESIDDVMARADSALYDIKKSRTLKAA